MTGSPAEDRRTRIAEIRQENAGGDVAASDISWLCDEASSAADRLARLHRTFEGERDQALADARMSREDRCFSDARRYETVASTLAVVLGQIEREMLR